MRKISFSPMLLLVILSHVLITGSFASLWTFCFALLHEAGHLLAMLLFHDRISQIRFRSFGICIETQSAVDVDYEQEIVIALAGPLMNGIVSLICSVLYLFWQQSDTLFLFCLLNLVLCIINLLPLYPLDGGRVLFFSLLHRLDPFRAEKCMRALMLISVPIMLLFSLGLLWVSGFNASLLLIALYLLIFVSGWSQLGRGGKM